jgi:hypothetical protein
MLAGSRRSVLLLDAHESAPAVAGRLGLGVEPNLRSAVDACAHGLGSFDECTVAVPGPGGGRLHAVAGHPSALAAAQVTAHDVFDVVAAATHTHDVVVVDVEARSATARVVGDAADVVVGVLHASPVGVVRGLEWIVDCASPRTTPLHLVVNHAPRSRFRQEEIRAEIERTIRPSSISWCPHDRAVEMAAWDGVTVARGRFRAACAQVAAGIAPGPAARRRWSTR